MIREHTNSHFFLTKRLIQSEVRFRAQRQMPATITYVEIKSEQVIDNGKATIVSGGIGQSNINIIVEIPDADYVDITATIYGKLNSFE